MIEKDCRQLNQHIAVILLHQSVRYAINKHPRSGGTSKHNAAFYIRNNGRELSECICSCYVNATRIILYLQLLDCSSDASGRMPSPNFNILNSPAHCCICRRLCGNGNASSPYRRHPIN